MDLYVSSDQTLDAGDALVGSTTRTLRVGRNRGANVRVDFPTPMTLADGQYYLIARSGVDAVVSRSTVAIARPFSDVAVSFASLPSKPIEINGRSSGRTTTTVRVTNAGNVRATPTVGVRIYLSADDVLDGSDALLAVAPPTRMRLAPGKSAAIKTRVATPPSTTTGGYFLFAVATPTTGSADAVVNNNVTRSNRRVAVVDRIPDRPVHNMYNISYYGGPSYYDDGYGYGYGYCAPGYYDSGYVDPGYAGSGYVAPYDDGGSVTTHVPPPSADSTPSTDPSVPSSDVPADDDGNGFSDDTSGGGVDDDAMLVGRRAPAAIRY